MKWFIAVLMDFLLSFPVILTIYATRYYTTPIYIFFCILLISYIIGLVLRTVLIKKNRVFTLLICSAWSIYAATILGGGTGTIVFTALISLTCACRSIIIVEHPHLGTTFPRVYFVLPLFLYFFSYIIYGRLFELVEYERYILIMGFLATPSALFMLNSDVLKQASSIGLSKSSAMPGVRRNNRVLITVTLLLTAFIASFNTIKDYFVDFLRAAFLFMLGLIDKIMNFLTVSVEEGPSNGDGTLPFLPPPEPATQSIWDLIWGIFVNIFAYIVLGIAAFMLIRYAVIAIRKLYELISALIKRILAQYNFSGDNSGYMDEKEALIDWQSLRNDYADRLKEWLESAFRREPKWSELKTNSQRIRYLYRHFILKCISLGYVFNPALTPNEAMNELSQRRQMGGDLYTSLKQLYSKARYSEQDIDDAEVAALKGLIEDEENGR